MIVIKNTNSTVLFDLTGHRYVVTEYADYIEIEPEDPSDAQANAALVSLFSGHIRVPPSKEQAFRDLKQAEIGANSSGVRALRGTIHE